MPSALARVDGENTRFCPGFCAHQARITVSPNAVSAAPSGFGFAAGSTVATPRTIATSAACVVPGVDVVPHPATAAVTQVPASTARDILIACRMPVGRSRGRPGSTAIARMCNASLTTRRVSRNPRS